MWQQWSRLGQTLGCGSDGCDCGRGNRDPLSDGWILGEVDDGMLDALTGCLAIPVSSPHAIPILIGD